MDLLAFFGRLADSDWSVALHESQYAYSIIESVHVWTLAVFFGSILMVDLRLLGLTMRKVPVSEVASRLLPRRESRCARCEHDDDHRGQHQTHPTRPPCRPHPPCVSHVSILRLYQQR